MVYAKLTATFYACLTALIVVENKQCKKANYDRNPGFQLQGHVVKTMTTSDFWNCVSECGNTPGCLSINSHNVGNVVRCELNKSNRYGNQVQLVQTSYDHAYFELKYTSADWPDACFQKDGWYRYQSTAAYKFVNEAVTVQEARQRCRNMSAGADLMSFADKEEEQIVDEYLKGFFQVGKAVWIGLNDIAKEGTYVWFDGSKTSYTNWESGEPNNARVGEDCTFKILEIGKGWADEVCTEPYPFLCKMLCT